MTLVLRKLARSGGNIEMLGRSVPLTTVVAAALLFGGLLLRMAWVLVRPDVGAAGEAFNVAQAFAEGRGFADAYGPGHGPTAHLLPTTPLLAGITYSWFGVRSPLSEGIQLAFALLLVLGSFLLLYRAFARLGVPRWARLVSLAFVCLAPAYIGQETVDFRIWEGGLAVALMALFLDRLLSAERSAIQSWGSLVTLGLICPLLFFVNPPMGLGAGLCAFVFAIRRLTLGQTLITAALGAAALAAMVVPWTMRNQAQLGHTILLRSNAGLELALSMHPEAWHNPDRGQVFKERLTEIHPAQSPQALMAMQEAGGEVEYARALGAEATDWMRQNKDAVAGLMLIHMRQVIAPETWQYTTFGTGLLPGLRAALASLAGVLGVLGIVLAILGRRPLWIYPAILVAVPLFALSLFQPVPRYTYLFFGLFSFAAGHVLAMIGPRLLSPTKLQA